MRSLLAKTLLRLAQWMRAKGMPYVLAGPQWTGTSYVDSFKRNRQPTPNEILAELKNTAWTCASINAATCANYPPQLYVITEHNQPQAKCATKTLSPWAERRLRALPHLSTRIKSAARIEEVTDASAADAAPARQSDSQCLRSLGVDHAVPGGSRQRLLVSRPRSDAGRAAGHVDSAVAERDAAPRSG